MKSYKTLIVLRHPRPAVWALLRDRMPDVVPFIDDVEAIERLTYVIDADDDAIRVQHRWYARTTMPTLPPRLVWSDDSLYRQTQYECEWRIRMEIGTSEVRCDGITRYETAMGGRGTRICLEGTIDLGTHGSGLAESFATTIIPNNFRKLAHAAASLLETTGAAGDAGGLMR